MPRHAFLLHEQYISKNPTVTEWWRLLKTFHTNAVRAEVLRQMHTYSCTQVSNFPEELM